MGSSSQPELQMLIRPVDRCCPSRCEYRVEVVQHHLDYLDAMRRAGEDPFKVGGRYALDEGSGGGVVGNGSLDLLDIQNAIVALRREHKPITAASVAERLCPWSITDSAIDETTYHDS